MALKQRTPEWREAKRALVTSTDLPIILGLSPYRSEGELAREKLGGADQEQTLQMAVGQALEPVIAREYERVTGARINRVHGLVTHPTIKWAGASPDARVVGARRLVEFKWTQARRWDDEELPQDVEAQVRWAMGVSGYPEVDVAAIVHGREFRVVHVDHDPAMFDGLVVIAEDFRRRLEAGGPFRETKDSLKALYPQDNGATMLADSQEVRWVDALLNLRRERDAFEAEIEAIEVAVKQRMADHARMEGPGWSISWKRTKDKETTNWKAVAEGLLTTIKPDEAATLIGLQTVTTPGWRMFKLTTTKEGHTA